MCSVTFLIWCFCQGKISLTMFEFPSGGSCSPLPVGPTGTRLGMRTPGDGWVCVIIPLCWASAVPLVVFGSGCSPRASPLWSRCLRVGHASKTPARLSNFTHLSILVFYPRTFSLMRIHTKWRSLSYIPITLDIIILICEYTCTCPSRKELGPWMFANSWKVNNFVNVFYFLVQCPLPYISPFIPILQIEKWIQKAWPLIWDDRVFRPPSYAFLVWL